METNQPIQIPESEVEQAILDGRYALPEGQRVNVISPDGKIGDVPSSQLKDALKQGYRYETTRQRVVRDFVDANKGLKGAAKVALGQFADETFMGVPETAAKYTNPWEFEKWSALKEEHDLANTIGGVGGFAASMFVGGPLFKAAGKVGNFAAKTVGNQLSKLGINRGAESVAKRIVSGMAENAAKLGAEGVVIAAPRAVTEASLGGPEGLKAGAEALMMNGLIGAGLGFVGSPLVQLTKKLIRFDDQTGMKGLLEGQAKESARRALGFTKSQQNKLKRGAQEADEIAEHLLNATDEAGQPLIQPFSDVQDIYQNVSRFNEESGRRLGELYQQLDDYGVSFNGKEYVQYLKKDLLPQYQGKLSAPESKTINDIIEDFEFLFQGQKKGEITFIQAKEFQDRLKNIAFPKGKNPIDPTPRQAVAQDAYFAIRDMFDQGAVEVAEKTGDELLKEMINLSRKDYASSIKAMGALEDAIKAQEGNLRFGLRETITGTAAAAAIDPITGILTAIGTKLARRYGESTLANIYNRASEAALFTGQKLAAAQKQLTKIDDVLDGKTFNLDRANASQAGLKIIETLANPSKPLDQSQVIQLKDFRKKVSDLLVNPEVATEELAKLTGPLQEGGAPNLAQAANDQLINTVKYINQIMPKPLSPPQPFFDQPESYSSVEIAAFKRKLEVINNPFIVMDALAQNTLTRDHVEALEATYPLLLQAIRQRAANYVIERKPNATYARKLNLSLLLGFPMVDSVKAQNIAKLQNAWALQPVDETQNQGQTVPVSAKFTLQNEFQTPTDKQLGR